MTPATIPLRALLGRRGPRADWEYVLALEDPPRSWYETRRLRSWWRTT